MEPKADAQSYKYRSSNQVLEVLYKYYFKLASIHPFGAWDLKMRRLLGVLFNEAATQSDLVTIGSLAEERQGAIDRLAKKPEISVEQLPCIDIIIVATTTSGLPIVYEALDQQSYPFHKITLTVILFCRREVSDSPPLPEGFLHARYIEIKEGSESSAYSMALNGLKSTYFLLMASPLVFGKRSLELMMQDCVASHSAMSLWEISPTLLERTIYYDPVTLEIPSSSLECGVVKRDYFDAIGGFDESFPIFGQGLELGYRLRAHGYRLKNIGQTGLFEPLPMFDDLPSFIDRREQQLSLALMQLKYGSRLQKVLASLHMNWHLGRENEFSMGSMSDPRTSKHKDRPKVSIIIRTFAARAHWLAESVCSVLNQTYPNIELVVVEDGSTEHREFLDVVSMSLRQGQTVKYLTQEKKGKSHAGNLGLAAATGQFIGFLDDDDVLFANHVELLLNLSLGSENVAGAFALAWEVQTTVEPGQGYSEEHFEVPRFTRRPFSRKSLEKLNLWSIQSVLFARRLYDQYGGFDTERVFLEDWELWLRYTQDAEFAYLPQITSMFRTPADPYMRIARVSKLERRSVN